MRNQSKKHSYICFRIVLLRQNSSIVLRGLLSSNWSTVKWLVSRNWVLLQRFVHGTQSQGVSLSTWRNCSSNCHWINFVRLLWNVSAVSVKIKIRRSMIKSMSKTASPFFTRFLNSFRLFDRCKMRMVFDFNRIDNVLDLSLQLLI